MAVTFSIHAFQKIGKGSDLGGLLVLLAEKGPDLAALFRELAAFDDLQQPCGVFRVVDGPVLGAVKLLLHRDDGVFEAQVIMGYPYMDNGVEVVYSVADKNNKGVEPYRWQPFLVWFDTEF